MNYEDVCKEAGVDPSCCNSDMRAVITYMAENRVTLDGIPQEIKDQVESWTWNHSIFGIYDEIKSKDESKIVALISYALQLFKDNVYHFHQLEDLALHLGVDHLITKPKRKGKTE